LNSIKTLAPKPWKISNTRRIIILECISIHAYKLYLSSGLL
jgi:hypothetical protein